MVPPTFVQVARHRRPKACIILSFVIGQSPRRKEDERLITGRGRFIDDVILPGLLHLVLVRSTHARARIVEVDAAAGRALPDVRVFLAGDMPELAEPLPAARADRANPYVRLDTPRPQRPLALGDENRSRCGPMRAIMPGSASSEVNSWCTTPSRAPSLSRKLR